MTTATYNLFKSRTFWLLVVAGLLPALNAIVPTLPTGLQEAVSAILGFVAIYTHNAGVQNFGARVEAAKEV